MTFHTPVVHTNTPAPMGNYKRNHHNLRFNRGNHITTNLSARVQFSYRDNIFSFIRKILIDLITKWFTEYCKPTMNTQYHKCYNNYSSIYKLLFYDITLELVSVVLPLLIYGDKVEVDPSKVEFYNINRMI